jgi:serine/threonine protein kinase
MAMMNDSNSIPSHDLRGNMMREHTTKDVFDMYEIVKKLGEGSMGSVCSVKKRMVSFKVTSKDGKGSSTYEGGSSSLRTLELRSLRIQKSMEKIVIDDNKERESVEGKRKRSSTSSLHDVSFSLEESESSFKEAPQQRRRSSAGVQLYAMKAIQLSRMSDEFVEELKNEIDILKSLDHPNIVKPIETFNRKRQLFVIMECCTGGDLYSRDPYSEGEAATIVGEYSHCECGFGCCNR